MAVVTKSSFLFLTEQIKRIKDTALTGLAAAEGSALSVTGALNKTIALGIVSGSALSQSSSGLALGIVSGSALSQSSSGLALNLNDTSLEQSSSGLALKVVSNIALQKSENGLTFVLDSNSGLEQSASGLAVKLASAGGLQKPSGELGIKLDGSTLALSANGLKANLTIAKQQSAETGYAATYYLTDGTNVLGQKINIVKDQFLESAAFGWFTKSGTTYTVSSKSTSGAIPCLKLVFNVNTDGDATDDEGKETVYLEVTDLFNPYTAGNGLALNNGEFSGVVDSSSGKVRTADVPENVTEGSAQDTGLAAVLSVGSNGFKVENIQEAINYAASKLAARITALENGGSSRVRTEVTSASSNTVSANYTTTSVLAVDIANPSSTFNIAFTNFPAGGEMIVEVANASSEYTINGIAPTALLSGLETGFVNGIYRVTCLNADTPAYTVELISLGIEEA